MSKSFVLLQHPILQHKLAILRNKHTPSAEFRFAMNEMSRLVAYEATRDLPLKTKTIQTPLEETQAEVISSFPIVVSIMRAGNGMLDGILSALPGASAGHIGIYRDKFIQNTVEYYFRLPRQYQGRIVLLTDPLIATGDTAIASIDRLKQYQVGEIRLLCLLASPEGVAKIHHYHEDVSIYAVSQERGLNEKGYLLPGIGDAGGRLYQDPESE